MDKTQSQSTLLGQALELPCGARLKNRLIKSAMSDSLGDGQGNSTAEQARLYERWASGGTSLSLIGEVQCSPFYPEKPGNLVLVEDSDLAALEILASRGSVGATHIWPQLGHAGALAHLPISRPKGPSPLSVEGLECDGMSLEELDELPNMYARAAVLAKKVGFGGVQVHAGHGFLFSQFLSPLFNHRMDAYGGSVEHRFRIIRESLEAIRDAVGSFFPIGIKINSTDQLIGGLTEQDALELVGLLDQTSVDLIDVSGGTYFPGAPSSSDTSSSSGPYFLEFGREAKALTNIPIVLTGGFRTKEQAAAAINNGCADAISLGRAMALDPGLANCWINSTSGDPTFPVFNSPPSGSITAWYTMRLVAMANDTENEYKLSAADALAAYEARDAERCERWMQRFA